MNELVLKRAEYLEKESDPLCTPKSFHLKSTLLSRMVDQVYVLAGPAERDRKYAMRLEKTLERLALHDIVSPLVVSGEPDDVDIKKYQMKFEENIPDRFVSGLIHQRGAAFKHLRALEHIVENEINLALICEDDILFHEQLQYHLDDLLPRIPGDADIVYLGYSNPIKQFEDSLSEPVPGIWKGAFWCLHCALVTYQGASKILNALPMFDQIDYFYGRLASEGRINAYAPKYLNEEIEASQICAYTARGFCYQEKDSK